MSSLQTFHFLPPRFAVGLELESGEPEISIVDDAFVSRREITKSLGGEPLPVQNWIESGGIYDGGGRLCFDPKSDRMHGDEAHRFSNPVRVDRSRVEAAVRVEDDCLYLGSLHGHFGHFLLESLSRAWALEHVPDTMPVVFHYPNGSGPGAFADPHKLRLPSFITTVLDALKIDGTRLVLVNKDLRIRRLLVPTMLHVLGRSAHAHLPSIYDLISSRIAGSGATLPKHVYLTRRSASGRSEQTRRRSVANEDELEALFASYGFSIVAPERLSFSDQVCLFREAHTIAGTTGSALHMCMFARRPGAHLIAIDWRSVTTQYLCELARGLRTDHIYAPDGITKDGAQLIDVDLVREALVGILGQPTRRMTTPAGGPAHAVRPRADGEQPALKPKSEKAMLATARTAPRLEAASPAAARPMHPSGTSRDTPRLVTASAQRLVRIAEATGAKSYLETGVSKGLTFNSLKFDRKVGVGSAFQFLTKAFEGPGIEFVGTGSDQFFLRKAGEPFDLIFINSPHLFQRATRDFCASLALAQPRTVWLIDDVLPPDVFSAMTDGVQLSSLRAAGMAPGTAWHGDVYKLVFAIHDLFPSFRFCTLTGEGNAQTLVWRGPRESFTPRFNSFEAIERLTYFELQNHLDVMDLVPEADGIALMKRDVGR